MREKLKNIEISMVYGPGTALAILIHRGVKMPKEITKRLRLKGEFRKKGQIRGNHRVNHIKG